MKRHLIIQPGIFLIPICLASYCRKPEIPTLAVTAPWNEPSSPVEKNSSFGARRGKKLKSSGKTTKTQSRHTVEK